MGDEERGPVDSLDKIFERIKEELDGIKAELKTDLKNGLDSIRAELREELEGRKSQGTSVPPPPSPEPAQGPTASAGPETGEALRESVRKTQGFEFKDFNAIEVVGAFDVDIVRSDNYDVSITAEDVLFRNLDVSREGNTLRLRHSRHTAWRALLTKPRARITLPALKSLRLGGATRATVTGFVSAEPFRLDISGASSLSGDLTAGDAEITMSGASHARLTGSARDVVIEAGGANSLDLRGFAVNNAAVRLGGASNMSIRVNGRLDARLSGVSRLNLSGNPAMGSIRTSGASQLVKEQ